MSIVQPICFDNVYTELDRVKIAVKGVERCKEENCDLIIVDATGWHKHEDALFEEMHQISKATVFIILFAETRSCYTGWLPMAILARMTGHSIYTIIVTKMDGHVMGGSSTEENSIQTAVEKYSPGDCGGLLLWNVF